MKRLELFEFEDYPWLPSVIRTGVTNLITVFHKLMGTADVIAGLMLEIKAKCDFPQIVDLGSGSGGAMLDVIHTVNEHNKNQPLKLILTDLHPNPQFVDEINGRMLPHVTYHKDPVNATDIRKAPAGLKTMIASFHHMSPQTAKKILQSAQENREPILIYEIAKNTVPVLLWWLLLPLSLAVLVLMTLVMTPFVRPLTGAQLVFTYLIPVIPVVYAWDGQASLMRTYTFKDVEQLLGGMEDQDYQWIVADAKKSNGKAAGYYIMGYPTGRRAE